MKIAVMIAHTTLYDVVERILEVLGHQILVLESSQPPGQVWRELDLIIVGSELPFVPSGIQFIQHVSTQFPGVPLLVLVNGDLPAPLKQELPEVDLLFKPFHFSEMQTAIAHVKPRILPHVSASEE